MKAAKVISVLVVIFAVLLVLAYRFDARSSADKLQQQIADVDQEMKALEKKALSQLQLLLLEGSPTKALIDSYQQMTTSQERLVAFERIVEQGQGEVIGRIDVNDPLKRRVLDEYTGALNRRRIVEERYAKLVHGH